MEDEVVNDGRVNERIKKGKKRSEKKREQEDRNRSDQYSIARHLGHA